MRTENEMYDLILNIAKKDDRILAVYMNGSRTNVNADKDLFQDYDIVYVVEETKSFRQDKKWISLFGTVLYMQYPDENTEYPSDIENNYGWLMQFTDGVRVDLHVETVQHMNENIHEDSLCKILLDKKNILPQVEESSDRDHWVKEPTEVQFHNVCNEFWWCSNNLAKGMWRREIPYVQDMMNYHVRPQLAKMLAWKIGVMTEFTVSVGKSGKYMYRWLSKSDWECYLSTYTGSDYEESWDAIERMCTLFTETAEWVGKHLGFTYYDVEGQNAEDYLNYVRKLPQDADETAEFMER